ncbi:hypothetical protein VST7929_02887 [Vibrio stylophorae]|uniref:MltA-interacting MipA family protein n=1 Tax=Vibrio stylophorae TaxID=659351 RepID=A0ABM8ZX64_9VIBR|nr:MipA/OmpV family protein [Vibrio stylophorae]CAH0535244.1 hypothetical protein VST7929_02887 [Vibrio stylophorae]
MTFNRRSLPFCCLTTLLFFIYSLPAFSQTHITQDAIDQAHTEPQNAPDTNRQPSQSTETAPTSVTAPENTLPFSGSRWSAASEEQNWGIALLYRQATVPYADHIVPAGSEMESRVSTMLPVLFYQGEYGYIDGTEGGLHLWQHDQWQLNAKLQFHFFDLPADMQNAWGGDSSDLGLSLNYQLNDTYNLYGELMSAKAWRWHSELGVTGQWQGEGWLLQPTAALRYNSARHNDHFYGLNQTDVGAGVDLKMGIDGRIHLYSNLYLLGALHGTYFSDAIRHADTMDSNWQTEAFVGFGFFNTPEHHRRTGRQLTTRPYIRLAQGLATPSNIGDIYTGGYERDPHNNTMTSLFYGQPLTDTLFGLPIDIYLTPGLVWHWQSEVQRNTAEAVLAIKAYYTVNWPTKWRFGVAEGMSYVENITHIEAKEMEEKGYKASHLLNYLDLSIDINIGDLFNAPSYDQLWFGYSLHHRSAIFESASQYNRIKGGSNYNTLYLQWDF